MKNIPKFNGFSPAASEFMLQLKFNNDRSWFNPRKQIFEDTVNTPFKALASEVAEIMQENHPEYEINLHTARIYRDARRLYGRGPYKDNLWFTIQTWSGKARGIGFWFGFDAVEYEFGVGCYNASATQMKAYRDSIDANPEAFKQIIREIEKYPEFELVGPVYAKYKKDVGDELNSWYNRKQVIIVSTEEFKGDIFSKDFPKILADKFELLMPFYEYFMAHCPPEPYRA